MPTFSHGSRAKLYLKDAAGTERDVSSYISETGLERELDTADVSALGDTHKKMLTGLADGGFDLKGHYDPTAEGYLIGLLADGQSSGTGRQFKYFPAGSATGKTYFDGTAICTSFNVSTGVDDAASFESAFSVQATPTYGTA